MALEAEDDGESLVEATKLARAKPAHGIAQPVRAHGRRLFDEHTCRLSVDLDCRTKRPRRS